MNCGEVTERMRELPEDQRAVLVLVAVEGYSYKEAARITRYSGRHRDEPPVESEKNINRTL